MRNTHAINSLSLPMTAKLQQLEKEFRKGDRRAWSSFSVLPPLGDRKLRGAPPPYSGSSTDERARRSRRKRRGGQRAQPKWSGRRKGGGERKIAPSFLRGTRKEKKILHRPLLSPFSFISFHMSLRLRLFLFPPFSGPFCAWRENEVKELFLFRRLPRSSPRSTLSFVGGHFSLSRRKTTTDEDDIGEGEERALSLSLSFCSLSTNNMWPGHILARGEDFPHIYAGRR